MDVLRLTCIRDSGHENQNFEGCSAIAFRKGTVDPPARIHCVPDPLYGSVAEMHHAASGAKRRSLFRVKALLDVI